MNIPDLRDNSEITLEHCSVLLERIGKTLEIIEGEHGYEVTDKINSELLLEHYVEYFEPEAFTRMFGTELGKGVLVGTYLQRLLDRITLEEVEDEP